MDHEEYLRRVKSYIKVPTKAMEEQLEDFCNLCTYISGQYDQDDSFITLNKHLEEIEQGRKEQNRVFYMALPPSVFITVSQHLKKNCYPKNGISRIIVEKPFGKDLGSSRELQRALEPDWKEEEIFRIDHYLGKEMVKNILILRFGNEFFGATWNRNHIDNVQISFKEPFGTEGRGGYFDEFGIVRDVMQNHLLQVLTLLAMERPISFSSEDIRDEKVRVLRGIPAIEPKNVIIGQYGKSLDGDKPSYKEDDTVPKDSRCPTFCAMVAYIKNERWDGVPFILKAGKGKRLGANTCSFADPHSTNSFRSTQRAEDRSAHPIPGRHLWNLQRHPPQRTRHPRATQRIGLHQDELEAARAQHADRRDRTGPYLPPPLLRSQDPGSVRVPDPGRAQGRPLQLRS